MPAPSSAQGVRLGPFIPNIHAPARVAYDQTRATNPRRARCYNDEDMVGKMKRVYTRRHGATAQQNNFATLRAVAEH
eukprot:11205990-Lingulodinium_polyedra.AAC.1